MIEENRKQTPKKIENRTAQIAIAGMLAGVYAALTIALLPISYQAPLNLRLANILIGIVPIIGWPAAFGISVGVFLANIASPLGPIDWISALFSLVGLSAIVLLRKKSVLIGLAIYSLILSFWVTFEISLVSRLPFYPTVLPVFAGISVVVVAGAYLFYRALDASGLLGRFKR